MEEEPSTYGGYQTACKNKKSYTTFREAKNHAKTVRKRNGTHIRPYKCIYCDDWHVGHDRRKTLRRLNKKRDEALKSVDKR